MLRAPEKPLILKYIRRAGGWASLRTQSLTQGVMGYLVESIPELISPTSSLEEKSTCVTPPTVTDGPHPSKKPRPALQPQHREQSEGRKQVSFQNEINPTGRAIIGTIFLEGSWTIFNKSFKNICVFYSLIPLVDIKPGKMWRECLCSWIFIYNRAIYARKILVLIFKNIHLYSHIVL